MVHVSAGYFTEDTVVISPIRESAFHYYMRMYTSWGPSCVVVCKALVVPV